MILNIVSKGCNLDVGMITFINSEGCIVRFEVGEQLHGLVPGIGFFLLQDVLGNVSD